MITTRKQLKALRGVFRKWIKESSMVRRETYNLTSRNHPPEIHMPPMPAVFGELTLVPREIDAIGAGRPMDRVPVSDATTRALIRHKERQTRKRVLADCERQRIANGW